MEDMEDVKNICKKFYDKHSLVKVVRKNNVGFVIGYINTIGSNIIVVKNDRDGREVMITYDSIETIFEMSGGEQ